jgi:hypothetical protein
MCPAGFAGCGSNRVQGSDMACGVLSCDQRSVSPGPLLSGRQWPLGAGKELCVPLHSFKCAGKWGVQSHSMYGMVGNGGKETRLCVVVGKPLPAMGW